MRRRQPEPERKVVAFFTADELMAAMFKAYPERFVDVPKDADLWFTLVGGGMRVDR